MPSLTQEQCNELKKEIWGSWWEGSDVGGEWEYDWDYTEEDKREINIMRIAVATFGPR